MTDKSWKLLTKLINACGYDITQIEDEFDFDELCDDIKNRLAFVNNYSYDYECQQKELDEYKQSLDEKNKFLQDLGISASGEFKRIKFYIENLKNKYNEKTEECEELISEKDFYLQKIAVLEQECEELKGKLRELKLKNITLQNRNQQLDGSIVKCDTYRKALEEIEKIIKEGDCTDCREHYYNQHCEDCDKGEILDIIDKAKGEGNEKI